VALSVAPEARFGLLFSVIKDAVLSPRLWQEPGAALTAGLRQPPHQTARPL